MRAEIFLIVVLLGVGPVLRAESCAPIPSASVPGSPEETVEYEQTRKEAIRCHIRQRDAERARVISDFEAHVTRLGEAAKGKEHAKLAQDRGTLEAIKSITEEYRPLILHLVTESAPLIKAFSVAYRERAAAFNTRLTELAEEGARAELERLAEIIDALVKLGNTEVSESTRWILEAGRRTGAFAAAEWRYSEGLAQYESYMRENGLHRPEISSAALQEIQVIVAVAELRSREFTGKTQELIAKLGQREMALVALRADDETRKAIAASRELSSAANFVDLLRKKLKAAMLPGATYLEPVYEAKRDLLAFEDVCANARESGASWMIPGCNAIAPEFRRARVYIEKSLPRILRTDLDAFKRAPGGDGSDRLKGLEEALARGDLLQAIRARDRLVHGGPP